MKKVLFIIAFFTFIVFADCTECGRSDLLLMQGDDLKILATLRYTNEHVTNADEQHKRGIKDSEWTLEDVKVLVSKNYPQYAGYEIREYYYEKRDEYNFKEGTPIYGQFYAGELHNPKTFVIVAE